MSEKSDKGTVLLIEDNLGFRFLFSDALEFMGYKVIEAEDGETGCEAALREQPDLILLDLMIPRLHGFDVLRKLKSDPMTFNIRIVVLSVLNEPKDIEKCMYLGASDYIVKGSLSPKEIIEKSCELIHKA